MYFRDALVHLNLAKTHNFLHPQLISCIYVSEIAGKCSKKIIVHLYLLSSQLFQLVCFLDPLLHGLLEVSTEEKITNRYNQVPHLTQDTTQEIDKDRIKHHTQESQEVSPFPAGDHKASNEQTRKHDKHETQITKMIHKRSTAFERSVNILLEGLNQFHSAILTLSSDVDQDT